jgi:DNA-binding transcriptional LysR family regulator
MPRAWRPAVIGRRIDALEERLGVKLLVRTTRRITLTHEGSAFLEDCQRLLADLANAEASVSAGGVKASGHLRITAPAGFGRRHVAPLVPAFVPSTRREPVAEPQRPGRGHRQRRLGLRGARGRPARLQPGQRAPGRQPPPVRGLAGYLQRAGTPGHPADLVRHECLTLSSDASQTRGWAFLVDGELTHLRPGGRLDCSDGQVLHDWCLRGLGIAWRSTWEVEQRGGRGRLQVVLEDFAAPPNGIYAVFPQRKHLPLRVRLWIDFLKHSYGDPLLARRRHRRTLTLAPLRCGRLAARRSAHSGVGGATSRPSRRPRTS